MRKGEPYEEDNQTPSGSACVGCNSDVNGGVWEFLVKLSVDGKEIFDN
jgi:hypothetical protein